MKNNFFYKFLIIFFLFIFNFYTVKAEQFNFNVTEIEILENGNLYKGLNRGTIETDNGVIINADTFIYNKLTNIVNAEGQVKLEDKSEQYEIYSEKLTYFKNEEKIITKGFTEANIQSEYNFKSKNVVLKLQPKELSSKIKSTVTDNNNQIYYLDEFIYYVNENLLKGKNILTITNYNLPKSDKFYFTDGIFNLKEKKFSGKDTRAIIHKNIFARDTNDPRIYSVSSKGNKNKTVLKKAIFTSCQ